MTECNCTCSLEQEDPYVGYQLNVQACALSMCMLSIHSPDYVFTVLVSIFIKPIIISEGHLSAINTCSLLCIIVRVMEFSTCITHTCALQTIRTTYDVRTYLRLQHYVLALRCRDKIALYVPCIFKAGVCPRPHRLKVEGERMGGYKITLLHFSAHIYRWDLAWGYAISHLYVWVGFSVGCTLLVGFSMGIC